ncbi:MAG: cellulase family glycosylhydrolase [Myxococcales bacterium]|nr:cellulase family glycosylhydrolase [Myxococcales bacterium]MCB9576690.1 cellulase family glycosylhydrolase [Polyangiaceae bacterium]
MRALALLLLATTGCGSDDAPEPLPSDNAPCAAAAAQGNPLGVHCGELVDTAGRVVYLRGVNARVEGVFDVTFDDGRTPLEQIPAFDAADATAMRDFGFDALRLPVSWSGIEPTADGGLSESYLAKVDGAVAAAASAGLQVLIDFHQDAYSKEIGEDGAPLWAISPPPTQLLEGPLTDLEDRRLSKQVLDAFETFFGDGAKGSELRQRFASMTEQVAARYADDPTVIGFEIFNEPQATDDGVARLNSEAYPRMRVAAPGKLYLFEPPVTRNFTDASSLAEAPLGPMTGYSPHVYTLAFVGSDADKQAMTKETLRRSNENARTEADSWSAPLVITEWGYDPNGIQAENYFRWQSELEEEYRASSFFWVWKEQSQGHWGCFDYDGSFHQRESVKRALARVRPAAVAGWPKSFSYDASSGVMTLSFSGNPRVSAPHRIAVAPVLGTPISAECDGASVSFTDAGSGVFEVGCGKGSSAEHQLVVRVTPL